ncbi:MAG: acyl-CoA thioesterase [Actinobacteria bacterium]|nr:acyl-CoA thioesterase [Actinomycetota bacterium]
MARVHVDLQLRWGEQDSYGHINNVSYARYLEEARVRVFWRGSAREQTGMEHHFRGDTPDGLKMLVASQHIEFLRVLEYSDQPITVELWIGGLGGSTLEIHYEIIDGSIPERTVVARAVTVAVVVDGATLRPIRLTEEGKAAVEPWRDEPVRLRHR